MEKVCQFVEAGHRYNLDKGGYEPVMVPERVAKIFKGWSIPMLRAMAEVLILGVSNCQNHHCWYKDRGEEVAQFDFELDKNKKCRWCITFKHRAKGARSCKYETVEDMLNDFSYIYDYLFDAWVIAYQGNSNAWLYGVRPEKEESMNLMKKHWECYRENHKWLFRD